jgi:DNA-binding Lrp family transcriptional regulator
MGNGSTAFVMINCKHGHEFIVLDKLRDINEIKEILSTFGSYDILVKIESSSVEHVRDVIVSKIRKMEEIKSTTTLMRINS